MIHIGRISFSLFLFVFFLLAFVASWVALPIALLFCDKQAQNLPRWAFWCDNPKYGINGNLDWVKRITPYGLKRTGWLARLLWLLRNPVGYVGQRVLSVNLPATVLPWSWEEAIPNVDKMSDPKVSDKGQEGFCLSTCIDVDGEEVWDYYYVCQWFDGALFSICGKTITLSGRRLVIRIGWKLQHATTPKTATYVCRINPFKSAPK